MRKIKSEKIFASKTEYPNVRKKGSSKGRGDHKYEPGWVQAKTDLQRKTGKKLKYSGSRKGQWAFEEEK